MSSCTELSKGRPTPAGGTTKTVFGADQMSFKVFFSLDKYYETSCPSVDIVDHSIGASMSAILCMQSLEHWAAAGMHASHF
jgi:hypothetical protein